jgi:glycosyltransferase involved in cell wall biosynthesis
MGKFFANADVLYFALKDCVIFNLTCPAKLQAYMSVGKPVLAMINGDGAEIVEEAKCGLAVPAGASEALADAICKMAAMSSAELEEMGMNGKMYCKENFTLEKNMKVLDEQMN